MGRTRQTSSTPVLVFLGSIQLIQAVPMPTLQPLFFRPSMVSLPQLAPTSVPLISQTPSKTRHESVRPKVTFEATATLVVASPSSSTASPSSPAPVSPPNFDSNEWEIPRNFTLNDLAIQHWNWGKEKNVAVLPALPVPSAISSTKNSTLNQGNVIQVKYPSGSINPANVNAPRGGMGFYASPLNLSNATNVTFSYSVFFPKGFEFVKGGKLPGLYGGRTGCSGGANSDNCFSTRLMFREHGMGELYLYAPKDKQGPGVCKTAPASHCNSEYGYSIGRGAWTFTPGTWTDLRQDIWLNTDGLPNGGFNVWVNGKLVMTGNDAYYRHDEKAATRNQSNLSKFQAPATPIKVPIVVAPTPVNFLTPGADASSQTEPTGVPGRLSVRRRSPHQPGRRSPVHFYTNPRLQARDSSKSSYYERIIPPFSDTDSTLRSRNLGPFPGLGYETLSANPTQTTPVVALSDLLASGELMRSPEAISPLPTSIPHIGYPKNPSSTSSLLGGLLGSNLRATKNHVDPLPAKFMGIMGETFFGGHDPSWATPRDQYTYFNSFRLFISASEIKKASQTTQTSNLKPIVLTR